MFTVFALRFWDKRKIERQLALHLEEIARHLNHRPPASASKRSLLSILQATCDELEQLARDAASREMLAPDESEQRPTPAESASPNVLLSPEGPITYTTTTTTGQPELPAGARELIKVSDWVLFAKVGGKAVEPQVLEEIYRQLMAVLEKEDVIPLMADGPYDYERQAVVGTRPTQDPSQVNQIYSTVRPGYLFHEQIIRAQEVIVYTAASAESVNNIQ